LGRLGLHDCALCCPRCHGDTKCPEEFEFEACGVRFSLCCQSAEAVSWTSPTFARVYDVAEPLHAAE
jgi:hypothetical protein